MAIATEPQLIPIQTDTGGVFRVGGTRVSLDTVVYAFQEGATADEIVNQYPALKLADVYAVLAYYLNNQETVDAYLQHRRQAASDLRTQIESRPEYQAFRERTLNRYRTKTESALD